MAKQPAKDPRLQQAIVDIEMAYAAVTRNLTYMEEVIRSYASPETRDKWDRFEGLMRYFVADLERFVDDFVKELDERS